MLVIDDLRGDQRDLFMEVVREVVMKFVVKIITR